MLKKNFEYLMFLEFWLNAFLFRSFVVHYKVWTSKLIIKCLEHIENSKPLNHCLQIERNTFFVCNEIALSNFILDKDSEHPICMTFWEWMYPNNDISQTIWNLLWNL